MRIHYAALVLFLCSNHLFGMDQKKTILVFYEIEKLTSTPEDIQRQIQSKIVNKNIWYQYGKLINKNRVTTLSYSTGGESIIMKSDNNQAHCAKLYRSIQNTSISQTIPFVSGFTQIPLNMPYVAYDPVRPELAIACGTSKIRFWRLYQANTEQILLGRAIQTWMCLEKPSKEITYKDALLKEIAEKMNLNVEDIHRVWNSFPIKVSNYWLTQLYQQIKKYGK